MYVLECGDKSLYTGITTDLVRRLAEHKAGEGSHYTRARGAKKFVYTQPEPTRSAALKREAQLKKLTRAQKLALIRLAKKPRL